MVSRTCLVLAVGAVLFLSVQGRPLQNQRVSQLHQANLGRAAGRYLLQDSSSDTDLPGLATLDPQAIVAVLKAQLPALASELAGTLKLPTTLVPKLEASLETFAAGIVTPLVDGVKRQEQLVEALVNQTLALLPNMPTVEDLTQLLKDTDYQQELFVVVNAVFDEDVLAAIDSGAKTLGSDIAALLEGAGILPAGSSTILTGAVSAMIAQILDATQDLQTFQSLVSSYASQVAALLFPLWG